MRWITLLLFCSLAFSTHARTDKATRLLSRIEKYTTQMETLQKDIRAQQAEQKALDAERTSLEVNLTRQRQQMQQDVQTFQRMVMELTRVARHPKEAELIKSIVTSQPGREGVLRQGQSQLTQNLELQQSEIQNLLANYTTLQQLQQEQAEHLQTLQLQQKKLLTLQKKVLKELRIEDEELATKLGKALPKLPKATAPLTTNAPQQLLKGNPVNGLIVTPYQHADENGFISHGLTVETAPAATIRATANGRIVFSGPFRDYGNMLILAGEQDLHYVYGGLGHAAVEVGDTITAGQALGTLPNAEAPHLYYETRKRGKAVQPVL